MPNASEFLVRVRPLPDGGFEATCQPVDVYGLGDHGSGSIVIHHSASDGQGATPLAAMIAALANSQVQDITQTQEGQPEPSRLVSRSMLARWLEIADHEAEDRLQELERQGLAVIEDPNPNAYVPGQQIHRRVADSLLRDIGALPGETQEGQDA